MTTHRPAQAYSWIFTIGHFLTMLVGLAFSNSAHGSDTIEAVRIKRGDVIEDVQLPTFFHAKNAINDKTPILIEFDVVLPSVPTEALGLFISRISRSGRLYVNGTTIGNCTPGSLDQIRCSDSPTLFEIPPELLIAGINRFQLHIYPSQGLPTGITKMQIGAIETIRKNYWNKAHRVLMPIVSTLSWAVLFMGLLNLIVGLSMKEVKHTYMGIALTLHSFHRLGLLTTISPINITYYEWYLGALRLVIIPFFIKAVLGFLNQESSALNRWLTHFSWTGLLIWAIAGVDSAILPWLHLPSLCAGGLITGKLTISIWRRDPGARPIFTGLLFLMEVIAVFEWAAMNAQPFANEITPSWYNLILFVSVFGGMSLVQITKALRESLRTNDLLQEKLAIREQELKKAYSELLISESFATRIAERERIMRDMHDGMGSTLSSAKLALQTGLLNHQEVLNILDDCTEDLRLILDCSAPQSVGFVDILNDYKYRLQRRLIGSTIHATWNIDVSQGLVMDPGKSLHIMRIIQEATTNALRHTKSISIDISVSTNNDCSLLTISISNKGSLTTVDKPGRGLENMRRRAATLNADLQIELNQTNSLIALSVPISPAERKSPDENGAHQGATESLTGLAGANTPPD